MPNDHIASICLFRSEAYSRTEDIESKEAAEGKEAAENKESHTLQASEKEVASDEPSQPKSNHYSGSQTSAPLSEDQAELHTQLSMAEQQQNAIGSEKSIHSSHFENVHQDAVSSSSRYDNATQNNSAGTFPESAGDRHNSPTGANSEQEGTAIRENNLHVNNEVDHNSDGHRLHEHDTSERRSEPVEENDESNTGEELAGDSEDDSKDATSEDTDQENVNEEMESSIEDDEAGDEELSDDLTVDSNVNEGTSSQEIEVESNSQNDERQEPDVGPASDQLDQPTDNEIHDSSSDSLDA